MLAEQERGRVSTKQEKKPQEKMRKQAENKISMEMGISRQKPERQVQKAK